MKKFLASLFVICLCIPLLTSCSSIHFKPKSADALWRKINRNMDRLKSYESDTTGTLSFLLDGETITSKFTTETIVSGTTEKDFYYYRTSDSFVRTSTRSQSKKFTEAFHNGKMFVFTENGRESQRIYSPMKAKEFISYLENGSLEYFNFNTCKNKSFTHNEDETWSLHYSGYSEKFLNLFITDCGLNDNLFDFEIQDMEIEIQADDKFRITEIKINFIFSEEDTKNGASFEIVSQYSNHDTAVLITDTLNPDEYTKVEDCRLVFEFENMLKKLEQDKNGSFVLRIEQIASAANKTEIQTETDTVSYGEKDGKYFYHIQADIDRSESINISYENGIQTVDHAGKTTTQEQTELEAQASINFLINSAQYDSTKVADIKKLISDKDIDFYEVKYIPKFIMDNYGSYRTITQTLKITIKDGNIIKMESIRSEGNAQYTLKTISTINFEE